MDSDRLNSLLREILAGVAKEDSRYIADEGADELWDSLVADIAAVPPGRVIDLPGEAPDADPESGDAAQPIEGEPQ